MGTCWHFFSIGVMITAFGLAGCAKEKTGDKVVGHETHNHLDGDQKLECSHDHGFNFTTTGTPWANKTVTVSFMPEGAKTYGGTPNDMLSKLDGLAPRDVWQREMARALASWSRHSALNFKFVADSGADAGISGSPQGDSRFGDIRFSMYDLGGYGALTYSPWPTGTMGGDVRFNSTKTYQIGAFIDLYTISLHETGHALGLGHSTSGTAMYSIIYKTLDGLVQDDIDGIQALYGARVADAHDAQAGNETSATATSIAAGASGTTIVNGDLTTATDIDHYRVVVPSGAGQILSVSLAEGQSLLIPTLKIYDGTGALIVEAAASKFGEGVSLQVDGAASGEAYVIVVDTPVDDDFGVGAYQLAVAYVGDASQPVGLAPDAKESNDTLGSSSNLGTTSNVTVSDLTIHAGSDQDYFHFKTDSRARTYQINLTYGDDSEPLEAEILSSSGSVRARSNGASSLSFSVSKRTTYKVKIFSPSQTPRAYSLQVRKVR